MDIVLIEPQNPGNIGAVARSMANFGFNQLVLINPCEVTQEARNRAKHAQHVLDNVKILKSFSELDYDLLIGTSAVTGKDYNIPRSPVLPHELELPKGKVALVFGREDTGLRNEELALLDFVVRIPTSPTYPTMNLSHAVTVLLYEFAKQGFADSIRAEHKLAPAREKQVLLDLLEELISSSEFRADHEADTQRKVWKKVVGKSFLTKREINALIGFVKRLQPRK